MMQFDAILCFEFNIVVLGPPYNADGPFQDIDHPSLLLKVGVLRNRLADALESSIESQSEMKQRPR